VTRDPGAVTRVTRVRETEPSTAVGLIPTHERFRRWWLRKRQGKLARIPQMDQDNLRHSSDLPT